MAPPTVPLHAAFVGLGSNLGDRLAYLAGGRRALGETPGVEVEAASAVYETAPVGGLAGQGPYLNAVLRLATSLGPQALLERCLAVEARFGRRRRERWEARTLDLDLLLFDDLVSAAAELTLPHPELHRRRFVLVPLGELAPDRVHPQLGLTVAQLLARLGPDTEPPRLFARHW